MKRAPSEEFRKNLESKMSDIFKDLQDKSFNDLTQANKDITDYREKIFAKIDEQAKNIIKDYIAGYFTQEASKKEHESIVFKALESFKNKSSQT